MRGKNQQVLEENTKNEKKPTTTPNSNQAIRYRHRIYTSFWSARIFFSCLFLTTYRLCRTRHSFLIFHYIYCSMRCSTLRLKKFPLLLLYDTLLLFFNNLKSLLENNSLKRIRHLRRLAFYVKIAFCNSTARI